MKWVWPASENLSVGPELFLDSFYPQPWALGEREPGVGSLLQPPGTVIVKAHSHREHTLVMVLWLPNFRPFPSLCLELEGYKQESQWSCKSWPSRKSVEKRLGAAVLRGARLSTGPPDDSSSQSMLSRWPSARSRPIPLLGSEAKCNSEVSMGDGGWSRMAELLSIWLWRSSMRERGSGPSCPLVSRGSPVLLSRKSSKRPGRVGEPGGGVA